MVSPALGHLSHFVFPLSHLFCSVFLALGQKEGIEKSPGPKKGEYEAMRIATPLLSHCVLWFFLAFPLLESWRRKKKRRRPLLYCFPLAYRLHWIQHIPLPKSMLCGLWAWDGGTLLWGALAVTSDCGYSLQQLSSGDWQGRKGWTGLIFQWYVSEIRLKAQSSLMGKFSDILKKRDTWRFGELQCCSQDRARSYLPSPLLLFLILLPWSKNIEWRFPKTEVDETKTPLPSLSVQCSHGQDALRHPASALTSISVETELRADGMGLCSFSPKGIKCFLMCLSQQDEVVGFEVLPPHCLQSAAFHRAGRIWIRSNWCVQGM